MTELISRNKVVYGSSVKGNNIAYNAVDYSTSTHWVAEENDTTPWIYVDLGSKHVLAYLEIWWKSSFSFATKFSVQVSEDSLVWDTVKTEENDFVNFLEFTRSKNGKNTVFLNNTSRYIRVFFDEKVLNTTSDPSIGLSEFRVFGTEFKYYPDTKLSHNKTAVSNVEDDITVQNITDNSNSTEWQSLPNDDEWTYIDLGENLEIGYIEIFWNKYYATEFDIQISLNSFVWETINTIKNDFLPLSTDIDAKWSTFRNYGKSRNRIDISRTTRFIKFLGVSRVSNDFGYHITKFNVYGRTPFVNISPPIPETTDPKYISITSTLKYNTKSITFNKKNILDFIFKYRNSDLYTSIYPTNPGSTYSLDILSIKTTLDGVYMELKKEIPIDIDVTILLSQERRVTHVSVPPSIRDNEVNYKYDVSYMNLRDGEFYIVEPVSRDDMDIRVGMSDNKTLNIDLYGFPWKTYMPLRLTIYREPHVFNNVLDKRLNLNNDSTYEINQIFHTPYIEKQFKDLKFKTEVSNYVPVSSTNLIVNTTANVPLFIPNEALDGDLVALDTPDTDSTFSSSTLESRLEPVIITPTSRTGIQVTVTLYRRVQFEDSIVLENYVHDFEFINKQYTLPVGSPNRNVIVFEKNDKTNIKLYGKESGTVEFKPVTWTDEILTDSEVGLTELFKQDVNILSKKGIVISSKNEIYMDNVNINSDKLIMGGGVILDFVIDTVTNNISCDTFIPPDTRPGEYTINTGSLQLENYISFTITINNNSDLIINNESLVVVGFSDTTVEIEKYISSIGETRNIQINKFVGIGDNSSITVNTSTDSEASIDIDSNNVNITGIIKAGPISATNIKTRNFLKNDDLEISTGASNIDVLTRETKIGSNVVFFTDNLRVSMDKRFTLIDTEGNDIVVSKDSYIETNTGNINITKIKDSIIPSHITIDTIPNTRNVYDYKNSGKVTKIGELTTSNLSDKTLYTLQFSDADISQQTYLDKIYTSMYYIENFGDTSVMELSNTVENGQFLTKTFKNNDNSKVLVETYKINIDTNITGDEVQLRPGLSYRPSRALDSVETIIDKNTVSIYYKTSIIQREYNREYKVFKDGYLIEHTEFQFEDSVLRMSVKKHTKANIELNNIQIGEYIIPGLTDGELHIRGNEPVMKTQNTEYTVFEDGTFFETSNPLSGLKTIHGTFVDTTEESITTTFCRNVIESEYQDPETYDSFFLDIGILDLSDDATFEFDSVDNKITKSNFDSSEILPGTYNSGTIQLKITKDTIAITPEGSHINVFMEVKRIPKIKPHGRHDKYIPPKLSELTLSKTEHTEKYLHEPENIYDIKYIGPESFLDFYCEGVWYPQLKISQNVYLDTYITYASRPKTKVVSDLAVNPFNNKQSLEEYGVSFLSKENTLAIKNAGVSIVNVDSTPSNTERKKPIENMSSLAWIKSKTVGSMDYIKVVQNILVYTTLFEDSTEIENVIKVLNDSVPEKTENLRKALFDISPIDIVFDEYIIKETSNFTITNDNWSKGLHVVGDKYVSEIKKAVMDVNGIENYHIDVLKSGKTDGNNTTFDAFYGVNPESDFNTSRVLSLEAVVREIPNTPKPGRWIKTGNVVWLSADITIPDTLNEVEYPYTVAGNPFEKLVRGTGVPKMNSFEYNNETYFQDKPTSLVYTTPAMIPDYILDTADSPFPGLNTHVNTDGSICIFNKQEQVPLYSDMITNRHKFAGTFQIIETFPDTEPETYTIPQDTDLSAYNYTLDDSGQPTFNGYQLKGTGAQFLDGIYTL